MRLRVGQGKDRDAPIGSAVIRSGSGRPARRWSGVALLFSLLLPAAAVGQANVLEEARALQRRLQYAEAHERLLAALPELEGESRGQAYLLLAELSPDAKEARRAWREAEQAAPSGAVHQRAVLELARLDFARGNYHSVRSRLEDATDDESRLLVAASWIGLEEGERAAAALKGLPASPRASLLRAWAARATRGAEAALQELAPLAASGGDFLPTVLLWQAECQAELGRAAEARTAAETLQRRFATAPENEMIAATLTSLRHAPASGGAATAAEGATTTPAGAAAALPPGSLLLQIGVFESQANALRLRDRLPPDIGPVRVDPVQQGERHFYRVALGPFTSASAATEHARAKLEPLGMEWRLVRPESP